MTENEGRRNEPALDSWKEIAAYLKRDIRTAKRWEKSEGLPVHRHTHQARSSVYAYPSELEAWKAARELPKEEPARMLWQRPRTALALAATLLLALGSVGSGPLLNPPGAAADDGAGMVARQVWSPAMDDEGEVSPDGRYLSFVDWETGDLAILTLETGEQRRLTQKGTWKESGEYAGESVFSPDSQQVVFGWFNGTRYDLRIVQADGSNLRILYANENLDYLEPGGWSPDGQLISVSLARRDGVNQIALYSIPEDSFRVIKTMDWRHPHLAPFSPDGNYLAYDFPAEEDTPQRDVFLLSVDGSREIRLVEHPANDRVLGWRPSGDQFLFSSDRTGTNAVWSVGVAHGRPQGLARLVKPALGPFTPLGFTREGNFYYAIQTGIRDAYVARYDPVAGSVTEELKPVSPYFVGSNERSAWSPDGERLAYLSYRSSLPRQLTQPVLVIESLASGQKRELSPELDFMPPWSPLAWSPDGRFLLAAASDPRGRQGLYRIDAATGETTRVVPAQQGMQFQIIMPAWTEAGIFYLRREGPLAESVPHKTSLVRRDPETGGEQVLYQVEPPAYLDNFAISPDGTQIVLRSGEDGATVGTLDVLKIIPAGGGEPRDLLRVEVRKDFNIHGKAGLEWTPDGRYVLFGRWEDYAETGDVALWRVSTNGGQPKELALTRHRLWALDLHPDGRRLAFTAGDPKGEVWVLENFLPELKAAK